MRAFIWVMFILQLLAVLGKTHILGSGKSSNKYEDIFVLVSSSGLAVWAGSLLW